MSVSSLRNNAAAASLLLVWIYQVCVHIDCSDRLDETFHNVFRMAFAAAAVQYTESDGPIAQSSSRIILNIFYPSKFCRLTECYWVLNRSKWNKGKLALVWRNYKDFLYFPTFFLRRFHSNVFIVIFCCASLDWKELCIAMGDLRTAGHAFHILCEHSYRTPFFSYGRSRILI